jgi:hypothetical protein
MAPTLAPPSTRPNSPNSSIFDIPTRQLGGAVASSSAIPSPMPVARASSVPGFSGYTGVSRSRDPSFLVVSGGTGCNSIVSAFGDSACYILPVSDDGGSSSEIIRVLGGPSIGMLRTFTHIC